MRNLYLLLLGLCLLVLPAAQCNPVPVPPSPSYGGSAATGGASQGGSTAAGGVAPSGGTTASGGATAAAGGSLAAGGSSAAIIWPECARSSRKLSPGDVERYRRTLGRRHDGKIVKRPRASYQLLNLPGQLWAPLAPTLDQGNLGSCTGNAAVQVRVSQPWTWNGTRDAEELEAIAVSVYSAATKIDPFDGSYPPDDTGSNGASAAAVAAAMRKRLG